MSNTAVTKFNELPTVMKSAPEVYKKNASLIEQAKEKGQSLLDTIEGEGMSAELDEECNKFLVKCKKADDKIKERRKPYTEMAQAVVAEFTALEGFIDQKKPESFYARIQKYRDQWAKQEADRIAAEEKKILEKKQKKTDKIAVKQDLENGINEKVSTVLFNCKNKLNNILNTATLENIDELQTRIDTFPSKYPKGKFLAINPAIDLRSLTASEYSELRLKLLEDSYETNNSKFYADILDTKQRIIDAIPARKKELEEIAKASKAEQKKLKKAAEERQKKEAERLEKEKEEAAEKAKEEASMKADLEKAETEFDAADESAQITSGSKSQTRKGFEIQVDDLIGWQQIAACWFAIFGKELDDDKVEKLERKTLGQMKTDCEKHAHKTGEQIDSKHMVYIEKHKAIARK